MTISARFAIPALSLLAVAAVAAEPAARTPATAARPARAIMGTLCARSASSAPFCSFKGIRYGAPPVYSAARLRNPGLTRLFDTAFDDPARRMRQCLKAKPMTPPRVYLHEQRVAWRNSLSYPPRHVFFAGDPAARREPLNAADRYFYCITHGGP